MSNTRLIIHTLMTGKSLKSKDIAQMMTEISDKEIRVQDVSGLLSRISDPQKCDMGYFICKTKDGIGFTYKMVKEMLALPLEKAYGLTLKSGKERYTLEKAFQEYPELRRHVENCRSVNEHGNNKESQVIKNVLSSNAKHENKRDTVEQKQPQQKPFIQFMKKLANNSTPQPDFINVKPSSDFTPANKNMEFTLRYSSKYSLSVSASMTTFFLICCAVVLTIAVSSLILYWFFYSVFVMIFLIGLCASGVLLYRKICGIQRR